MKNYYYYQEYPHYDMKQNFDNYHFEDININQNYMMPSPRPCGCMPPMPPRPIICNSSILWLLGGIVIGKILN